MPRRKHKRKNLKPTKRRVRKVQRLANRFTKRSGLGVAPLRVDGSFGPATKKRVRFVKRMLGFGRKKSRTPGLTRAFIDQLEHPRKNISQTHYGKQRTRIGRRRRIKHRKEVAKNAIKAVFTSGVGFFDGKPCAKWIIPYLQWARANGWPGQLNSGWRDPAYSEHLCYGICGRPTCSGRCAGRSSAHSQSVRPRGAADVSFYDQFGNLMRRCPLSPHLWNDLPIDPVHYSSSGH